MPSTEAYRLFRWREVSTSRPRVEEGSSNACALCDTNLQSNISPFPRPEADTSFFRFASSLPCVT
jgi:hypothetical protein